MSAPRWMVDPQPEELAAFAAAVFVGSLATNLIFKATTLEQKGFVMIVSGLSTIAAMATGRALCEKSERGLCAYLPRTVLP